jgi:hypothetical protein
VNALGDGPGAKCKNPAKSDDHGRDNPPQEQQEDVVVVLLGLRRAIPLPVETALPAHVSRAYTGPSACVRPRLLPELARFGRSGLGITP